MKRKGVVSHRHPRVGEGLVSLLAIALLAACGDTVENTTINQTGVDVYASADELPECTEKNEGEQSLVKGETSVRICVDGEWAAMKDDFSCKTVELKDKSGYKIVCNGDSIGVVLNGSDGRDGKNGEDGADGKDAEVAKPDTTVNDSEKVAVSLDSLVGVTQKGPFLKGSTVYLYELSDGRTLKQTNGNFTSNITSNDGRYKFTARDLVSQYAMVVVDGYYRNEVTGVSSDAPIRLKALTDMRKRSSVNVNLLTHMEFDRVYNLVTRGDKDGKKMTVKQAKRQAQKEILKQFHIELDSTTDAEDMDVFGASDADAALLAVSVLLQGDSNATALSVLLTEISNDIAVYGEWRDSAAKTKLADWALVAECTDRLQDFRRNVKGWGLSDIVPDFEKLIRNYVTLESGLGICGSDSVPANTAVFIKNPNSVYYASYDTTEGYAGSKMRFICKTDSVARWRVASDLEKDTLGWGHSAKQGAVKNGQINTELTYVYDNDNWRHGTFVDSIVGIGCTSDLKDSSKQGSDGVWYRCMDDVVMEVGESKWLYTWQPASALYSDSIYWAEHVNDLGTLLVGPATGIVKVYDKDTLRLATKMEIEEVGKGCVSYIRQKKEVLGIWQSMYTCENEGWVFDSSNTITDPRDSQKYKTVRIGSQYWMAQNLNHATDNSFCYKDDAYGDAYCSQFGRLYTWAAALTACPTGWHLPTKEEWQTLIDGTTNSSIFNTSSKKYGNLMARSWYSSGNDGYGFTAIPAGRRYNGSYVGAKGYATHPDAYFWSFTEYNQTQAYYFSIMDYSAYDYPPNEEPDGLRNDGPMKDAYSVRCVKD